MPIEEKFAADATVKDKRVQEMAYTDVRMSVKTITETVAIQPKIAVSNAGEDVLVKQELKFKEPSLIELGQIEEDAKLIKEDGASSVDDKGAAEIIEDEREGLTYTFNTAWDCPREIVFKLQEILDEELPFITIESWNCVHEDGQEEEQII